MMMRRLTLVAFMCLLALSAPFVRADDEFGEDAPTSGDQNSIPQAEKEEIEMDSSAFKTEEEFETFKREKEEKDSKEKMDGNNYCGKDDCYEVLGLTRHASMKTIKKTYRKLARDLHPDRPACKATDEIPDQPAICDKRFSKLGSAYGIVGDERKRKDYEYYLDHPEERVAQSWEYLPAEMDARFVIVMTIIMAQLVQMMLQKMNFTSDCERFSRDTKVRNHFRSQMGGKASPKAGKSGKSKGKDKEAALDAFIAAQWEDPAVLAEFGLEKPGLGDMFLLKLPMSLLGGQSQEAKCAAFLKAQGPAAGVNWASLSAADKAAYVEDGLDSSAGQAQWFQEKENALKTKNPVKYKMFLNQKKGGETISSFLNNYKKKGVDLGPMSDE